MQALSQLSYTPGKPVAKSKRPINWPFVYRADPMESLAEWTGLEPATPGVTGRYSNQLNYHSAWDEFQFCIAAKPKLIKLARLATGIWRPLGDSNPCNHRERVVS
jgi:hypothetical protein